MGLESVGGLGIHTILAKLGARDAAVVAGVSKRFKEWASDDFLWSKFCAHELHLSSPKDPLGNPCPSFKAAYQSWRKDFGMYPWPLVGRVKNCWARIRSWLTLNFPEALATLRKGASEDDIKHFEKCLNVNLPLPTRLLFRFCDGQELTSKELGGSLLGSSCGLIGGYTFYDRVVNVSLLPLKQVIRETKDIIRHLGFSTRSRYVVVAASSTPNEKIFFLNCLDGQLYVGTRNLSTDGEMLPCVPNGLISSVHDSGGTYKPDAMLLWLEEHVRRLETGIVKLREEQKVRSICLFPEQRPTCSTAVTNGVQVPPMDICPALCF